MGDYMFMLESHLTGEQYRVVGQVQADPVGHQEEAGQQVLTHRVGALAAVGAALLVALALAVGVLLVAAAAV